ncbi:MULTISPECIES: helix-turn-helix transcriptional regulator [unclassified Xenorhabdus]|uniref:helix-turn-helix domain-containing protein n=1 Tax=Xenorhabdus TaxID=626 RepID=UPI0025582B62|nr:helix-turn-helix transcriptional regulator [Xenorhabdus sp. SF857]WFQ80895.1 helix-turn-helix transcriptional regulator [Xenorhabdus sp. SF857]
MSTIGFRIKEERERLGLSQTDFAYLTGYSSQTQINFENDVLTPESLYLQEIAKHGFDTVYIITGLKKQPILADEQEIIDYYRAMNSASRLNLQAVSNTFSNTLTYPITIRSRNVTNVTNDCASNLHH